MIDINRIKSLAKEAFQSYASLYDITNQKIRLKIDHTYRVADIAFQIGSSVEADVDFCWFLGLLHDIGRFEQLKRYDTFKDTDSVDHAELGADILFHDGLIDQFPTEFFSVSKENASKGNNNKSDRRVITEKAIRLHNKLTLPDGLDEETRLYCRILRSADKCDIMRVLTEPPFDERNARIMESTAPARDDVMQYVRKHCCAPKQFEWTEFESLICQCCMAFELDFPVAWEIVNEQGYLRQLVNLDIKNTVMKEQLALLRNEIENVWG